MARNALLIGLAGALLMAAVPAGAQVATLTEEVRWGSIHDQPAPEVDLSQRKTMIVPTLPSAPNIDAQLDDDAWQAAAKTDTWMVNTGEMPAPVQTTAWVGLHGDRFYVGVRAEEPNVEGIVAGVTEDGGPAWNDDCIEMFIDGNLDLQTARQFVINSLGTVTTLSKGEDWNPKVTRAARVGDDAWFAEFALPIASLGLTGSDFGLNICRERRVTGDLELSCWSPTGGGFHQPGKFSLASLPGGYLKAFGVGKGMLGQNEITVTIANPDERERRLSAELTWWQGEGIALERTLGPFTIPAGEMREVTFGYDIQSTAAPVQLEIAVLDEDGKTLAQRETTQQVVDVLDMAVSRRLLVEGDRRMMVRGVMHLKPDMLDRTTVVLALFDSEMLLEAREELSPLDRVMRAGITLPPIGPGNHTLHLVLKHGHGDDARRVAEEKMQLVVLSPVDAH